MTRPDNGPLYVDSATPECGAKDSDYFCTAAKGHTGPHMAYGGWLEEGDPPDRPVVLCHSWPRRVGAS